ncbi:MAG: hypothetical protein AB1430_04015 [Pseudomonadota bacterium]
MRRAAHLLRLLGLWLAAAALLGCAGAGREQAPLPAGDPAAPLPERLHDTGLYAAARTVRTGVLGFTPQYPLWSDGAEKRRWIYLPPGSAIDASKPDAWEFPLGTRLWKEFAVQGRPVETRFIERLRDGSWRFATYVWNAEGTEARLAPARGARVGRYAVPSRGDCFACHGSAPAPVLGFAALQLSTERDPLAAGAQAPGPRDLDLRVLVERGLLRGLPQGLARQPPRIAAVSPLERAALGSLHGNCAHCHNTSANRVPLKLTLAQRVAEPALSRDEVLRSVVDVVARYQPAGRSDARIVAAGHPEASLLVQRMASRDPRQQMPPLGTERPDYEGLALVQRWIASDLATTKPATTKPATTKEQQP